MTVSSPVEVFSSYDCGVWSKKIPFILSGFFSYFRGIVGNTLFYVSVTKPWFVDSKYRKSMCYCGVLGDFTHRLDGLEEVCRRIFRFSIYS